MPSFGEKLKREREKRKVTLEQISGSTKIGTRMLQALEEDKFNQLPGGIFNKGFVRAYARFLDLDEDQTVADYLLASGDLPPVSTEIARPEERARENADTVSRLEAIADRPARQLPWGLFAALLLVVALILSLWSHRWREHARQPTPLAPTAASTQAVPAQGSGAASGSGVSSEHIGAGSPRPGSPSHSSNGQSSTGQGSTADNSAGRGSNGVGSTGLGSTAPGSNSLRPPPQGASPSQSVPSGQPASAPADPKLLQDSASQDLAAAGRAATEGEFTVVVHAREESWISITADGKTISSELLPAGNERAIRGRKQVIVKAGNSGGTDFRLNGKKLDVGGEFGEVKTVTFGPQGILPNAPEEPSGP